MKLVLLLLILIVLFSMSRTEMFTEAFGFSGFSKPIDTIILNEPEADLS